MTKYAKKYPIYKYQSYEIKCNGQGHFAHTTELPENEIMWVVDHYHNAQSQLNVLEKIRWLPYNIQERIKLYLKYACDLTGAT